MASVIADMALPGLTGIPPVGPMTSAPTGFAALLTPAPVPVAATPPLSLPKGIDLTIAAALMPAEFGPAGRDVPSAAPVIPLANAPAIHEDSQPTALVESPVVPQPPFSASDIIAGASPLPTASLPQAEAPIPVVTPSDEPAVPAQTPNATPDRDMASPDPAAATKPPVTAKAKAEPLAADPNAEAAEQAQPVSEPAQAPTPRPETSTPAATRPIAAKTPRLARTLPLTPALPDNRAPLPEAAISSVAAKIESHTPEKATGQPVEEAPAPVIPVLTDAPLSAPPIAPTEPAPMRTETKAPASEPVAPPISAAAVQALAPESGQVPVPSDTPTPPTNDSGATPREPATPTASTAADTAPTAAAPPSFGELVAPKSIVAPPLHRPEHPIPVSSHPDRIAPETAIAISRHLATAGAETITIRLDPVDMGRIEVRLSFDEGGALRGVIAADNPAALDLLRRDQAGLVASLSDAGVATDAQSLRFDTRSDDRGGQRQWTQRQPDSANYRDETPNDEPQPEDYRPLNPRGRVDVMA